MTLRSKLWFAQSPLVAALVLIAAMATVTAGRLGRSAELILKDNYRSVLAAQRMKEFIERIDSAALYSVAGRLDLGAAQVHRYIPRFESELEVQEGNVTEPGESEATAALRREWNAYRHDIESFLTHHDPETLRRTYFAELGPEFERVKSTAEHVLELNQDAMVRKSDLARIVARRVDTVVMLFAFGATALGLLASVVLTNRLLRPLANLREAARRLGEGDPKARAHVRGRDEIADVAREFNTMADHLGHYRASSLGELIQAQQQAQSVLDSLPDPVVVFAVDRSVVAVNSVATDQLGIALEPGKKDPVAGVPPELRALIERVRDHVLAGLGPFVPRGFDDAVRTDLPGGELFFLPRAMPVRSEDAGLIGAAVLLQDVTRLVRFDELKSNLVATVAHEFRTPLTSLRMSIHLCLEQVVGPLTEKQADLLYAARQDTERLQQIVDDLLDLSRIQAGRVELRLRELPVEGLISDAVEAVRGQADARHVSTQVEVLPGQGNVPADSERIALVFSNLLSNAVRHTPPGGTVMVRAARGDRSVRFEVTDTGEGIPKEYQRAIFDKFFRVPGTPSGGAGLGLYIAKETVRAHGGEIGVQSEPGHGATFWFELPLVPETERQPAPVASAS